MQNIQVCQTLNSASCTMSFRLSSDSSNLTQNPPLNSTALKNTEKDHAIFICCDLMLSFHITAVLFCVAYCKYSSVT